MKEFIINDFLIITLIVGFLILLFNNLQIEDDKFKKIKILLLLIILLETFNFFESCFSTLPYHNIGRVICSFLCYSLRPFIIITFISLLTNSKLLKYFYSLSIINLLIYSTGFYSELSYYFTSDNKYQAGPLIYSIYIICIIYLLLMIYIIIKKHNKQHWNSTIMLLFISIFCSVSAFLDYIYSSNLFDQTILICALIYYLFLYMEYNKIDSLTKLFNRTTFYNDIKKDKYKITSIISIDMNNLKYINDKFGHLEGDKALNTIAKILLESDKKNIKCYRIGGDEFVILCHSINEDKVKELINNIKKELLLTKYSCSIGYEMNKVTDDINDIYKKADEKMYKDKEKFHNNNNNKR